jgi:3-deoxy-D-manno-octulosonic-acid transferase
MILLFYNLALFAGLVASTPWWLWRIATTHKYREGLGDRLGRVPPWLRSKAGEKPVLWLHAVSVGEVLAVSRLIGELDKSIPDFQVLVSTTTRTGQVLARERFGPNRVFYCPLDLRWAVHSYLNALKPRMLILAETEFWPNLLHACARRGIPVAVVNARISDRSWPRYRMLRRLWRPFLSTIGRALAQSETDAKRLSVIGLKPERVSVAGNLKFDVRAVQEAEATRLLRSLAPGLRFLVGGSTLDGEEAALLECWPKILQSDPRFVLVLAPRHPERFAAVEGLLDRSGVAWVKRSSWKDRPANQIEPIKAGQVVLLDTIGELASAYSLATIAVVGGSFVPAGGHNPLEPAQFGVSIVMGSHYDNFRAITDDLRADDAIRIASREELARTLIDLLSHPAEAAVMGARAKQVFGAQAGATGRTVRALQELLAAQGPTT